MEKLVANNYFAFEYAQYKFHFRQKWSKKFSLDFLKMFELQVSFASLKNYVRELKFFYHNLWKSFSIIVTHNSKKAKFDPHSKPIVKIGDSALSSDLKIIMEHCRN